MLQAQTAHLSSVENTILTHLPNLGGIAVDRNGNVYLSDLANAIVLKESPVNGAYIESVVPTPGVVPLQLAVDGGGNLYIIDREGINPRVVKETLSSGSYTQSVVLDQGVGDPGGIAVDGNGNIYISDRQTGTVVKETLSNGSYTNSTIRIRAISSSPEGVAVDGAGNVYVADPFGVNVYKETPSGSSYIQSVVADYTNGLSAPVGVAVDPSGNIYIADAGQTQLVKETPTTGGYKQTFFGSGLSPSGVAIVNDDIYIVEKFAGSVVAKTAGPTQFGAFGVGTHSNGMTLTFTFDSAGTIGSPAVLTQGATGLDFADNGTGSCNANGTSHTYNVGDTCTVDLTFTPTHPGTRYGGVDLLDSSGSVIVTAYVYGAGVGPQVAFSLPSETTVPSNGMAPLSVAVDENGDVFIADTFNNRVLKETLSGSSFTQTTVGSGLSQPQGVAVDGSGNLYIADVGNNRVLKETLSGSSYTQTTVGSGLSQPSGVAVDGSGNVYIGDTGNVRVLKETLSGSSYTQSIIVSGLNDPQGVAVDGSGSIYIADGGNNRVLKETLSGGSYSQTTIGSGMSYPSTVALDGSGNVYITDTGYSRVLKETLAGGSYTQTTIDSGAGQPTAVAVDGSGNIYIGDQQNNRVLKEDVTTPPSLSFAKTNVGSTSSDSPQSVTLQNIGNADLSFPIPLTGDNPSLAASFTLDGSSTCPQVSSGASSAGTLTAGASCTLAVNFSPAASGSIKGSVVLTDNNLNASGPNYVTQTVGLSGVGNQIAPTITFAIGGTHTFGDAPFSVAANSNSSGAITYSLVSGPATVSSTGLLTISGAGTVVVQASQAVSGEYLAGTAQATFTALQAAQTITFANPGAHAQGGTFTLAATGGASKNPIVFSSSTTSVCTVSGVTVSLVGPGTCTITATQSGNTNYLDATPVPQSFQVTPVFLLTATPRSQSYSAPGTAPVVLTLQPVNGFSGTVMLSCSGLPTGAVCPGLPHSYQINGKSTVTFGTGVLFPKGTKSGAYTITFRASSGLSAKYNNATTVTINVR